jgi:hypothetical protein
VEGASDLVGSSSPRCLVRMEGPSGLVDALSYLQLGLPIAMKIIWRARSTETGVQKLPPPADRASAEPQVCDPGSLAFGSGTSSASCSRCPDPCNLAIESRMSYARSH